MLQLNKAVKNIKDGQKKDVNHLDYQRQYAPPPLKKQLPHALWELQKKIPQGEFLLGQFMGSFLLALLMILS